MKTIVQLLCAVLMFSLTSCKEEAKTSIPADEKPKAEMAEKLIPEAWIKNRVSKAKSRLEATEAGKVVWNAMEAHGGLEKWYSNGALSFRFNYQPLDGSTQRDSYQTINTWNNITKHTSVTDSTAHYGWSGKTSWVTAKDSTTFAYDTKFWALTPLYFLAQPFVLDGAGVNLELLPKTTYKEKSQDVVKVTFDAGTGDAPDDYYILYFEADSHELSVIRYIVSYPKYFKDGGHLPEKFMEVIGKNKIDGILFPTGYKTHWLVADNQPGEYITKIDVSDIKFEGELAKDYFDMPADAILVE